MATIEDYFVEERSFPPTRDKAPITLAVRVVRV